MQAIEMALLIAMAIIVGMIATAFIAGWDPSGMSRGIRGKMMEDDQGLMRLDADQVSSEIARYAALCRQQGNQAPKSVYGTGQTGLSKSDIFTRLKQNMMCDSVQSAANGCGTREDVNMSDMQLPKVIHISCIEGVTQVR